MTDLHYRHLALRTFFGATLRDQTILKQAGSVRRAVDLLLKDAADATLTPPALLPEIVLTPEEKRNQKRERKKRAQKAGAKTKATKANEDFKKQKRKTNRQNGQTLKMWWLSGMQNSAPLRERMTLFWHNHFTSSLRKVRSAELMLLQNQTLRTHALGNFGTLLGAMLKDPALSFYLDNQKNKKRAPNENLARELLELFTLGIGHYSEKDIREIARALTGLAIDRREKKVVFRPRQHDKGVKTIFGQSGKHDADAVVRLILARDETARFVVTKLWRTFVSQTPDDALINTWAAAYKASNYATGKLLQTMLSSERFLAEAGRGSIIKSPLDVVVGLKRSLGVNLPQRFVLRSLQRLGQDPFDPPNVRGWPGGTHWITTAKLSARTQFVARAFELHETELAEGKAKPSPLLFALAGNDPFSAPFQVK